MRKNTIRKNILLSYLVFFASQSSNAGYQEQHDPFCSEDLKDFSNEFTRTTLKPCRRAVKIGKMAYSGELAEQLDTYAKEIKQIVDEGKLGEKLAEACEAEGEIICKAFNDPSRANAMKALCAVSLVAFNATLGVITGFLPVSAPVTVSLFILGNSYITINSVLTVAHDEEINTIAKGAGAGLAQGLMSGLSTGTFQGIAHFLPLVDGHSHEHVLNIAHTVQDHANPIAHTVQDHANLAVHPDNLGNHINQVRITFQNEVPQHITSSNFDIKTPDQSTTINVKHFSCDHELTVRGSGVNFKAEIVPQDDGKLLQITCNNPEHTGSIRVNLNDHPAFEEHWNKSPLIESSISTDTVYL